MYVGCLDTRDTDCAALFERVCPDTDSVVTADAVSVSDSVAVVGFLSATGGAASSTGVDVFSSVISGSIPIIMAMSSRSQNSSADSQLILLVDQSAI